MVLGFQLLQRAHPEHRRLLERRRLVRGAHLTSRRHPRNDAGLLCGRARSRFNLEPGVEADVVMVSDLLGALMRSNFDVRAGFQGQNFPGRNTSTSPTYITME